MEEGRRLTWGARASMRLLSAMVSVALLTSLRLADSRACLHNPGHLMPHLALMFSWVKSTLLACVPDAVPSASAVKPIGHAKVTQKIPGTPLPACRPQASLMCPHFPSAERCYCNCSALLP